MILLQAVADGRLSGGTTHVLQLVEAVRAGLPVEVHLVSQTGSPALEAAAARGATVHGIDFFAGRADPRVWLGLARLIRRLRPGLIHAHGARAALPLSFVRGERPLFYTVHGYHFVGKPPIARQLAVRAERWCSARAERTLFVCRHDRDRAEAEGILGRCRDHRIVHNGIVLDGLPQATGTPEGRTLGYLGRLSAEKNPGLVLEVLACLDARQPGRHRAVVVGDGPLMANLVARARDLGLADRVELTGALPRHAALRALAATDLLLLPSLWEGLPLAPLEAMAMGLPVVAAAVGGLPEIIDDGVSGRLIAGHDAARWADAVAEVLGSPGRREALVARGRRVVAERFDWARIQTTYLDLYREALLAP